MSYLLRWLREAGILICTISLLFLPWFYDAYPLNGLSTIVMGTEFLAVGSTAVIGGFICLWLSYLFSRFTPLKWPTALLFLIGLLSYGWIYLFSWWIPMRGTVPGIFLDRFATSYDKSLDPQIGVWLNLVGILLLLAGLVLALKQPKVTVFILSTSGVILGMFLFWIWIDVHYQLIPIELPEVLMWMSLPGLPIIGGLIGFFLARKYKMTNEIPLSA